MYEIKEKGIKKTVYLLDEKMHINTVEKVSENLLETVVEIVPIGSICKEKAAKSKREMQKVK